MAEAGKTGGLAKEGLKLIIEGLHRQPGEKRTLAWREATKSQVLELLNEGYAMYETAKMCDVSKSAIRGWRIRDRQFDVEVDRGLIMSRQIRRERRWSE